MPNRIRSIRIVNHRLDPHETELRLHVELAARTPATEIKGRLMGPRNAYASTVEIAYPMRWVGTSGGTGMELRVIIPEANWWSPEGPFLYEGPLELWQDGERLERIEVSHGIKHLRLTSKGLSLNGKAMVLRGRSIESGFTEAQAQALHQDGVDLLLSPWTEAAANIADRYGFFLIQADQGKSESAIRKHACSLSDGDHEASLWRFEDLPPMGADGGYKVVVGSRLPQPLPDRADVIGWIEMGE